VGRGDENRPNRNGLDRLSTNLEVKLSPHPNARTTTPARARALAESRGRVTALLSICADLPTRGGCFGSATCGAEATAVSGLFPASNSATTTTSAGTSQADWMVAGPGYAARLDLWELLV
jgi:hypothetical protein